MDVHGTVRRLRAGQLLQQGVGGTDAGGDDRADAGLAGHVPHVLALLGRHDGDDHAVGAGAGRAAGAVEEGLVLGRRVHVHHQAHVVHMDAAGGDVGGDEDGDVALGELGQVALAGVLRQVAVQFDRGHALLAELLHQLLGTVLGAGEEQGAVVAGGQAGHHGQLVHQRGLNQMVRHRVDGGVLRVERVGDRVVEVAVHQHLHVAVERGGEQQALAVRRGAVHQALHAGQEAHVGHVVGLVQHGDLDLVQPAVVLADQVLQAARAGDDDVDAGLHGSDLVAEADAAVDDGVAQAGGLGERGNGGGDLVGQLAGGHQHEGAGRARAGPARVGEEAGDERDGERQRLAAAGAAAAEHVAAGERVGEGGGLDGERRGDAVGGERGLEGRGHAEGRERARRGHGGHGGSLCVGVAVLAKGHAGTGNRCTRPLGGSATTPNTLPGIWG